MKPMRILFPTDLSSNADTTLGHALLQAEVTGAELHILHCIHWNELDPAGHLPDPDTILDKAEECARIRIAESLSIDHSGVFQIVERTRKGGSVAGMILDYIGANAIDMVVMGNHGRQGIRHFLLGSVAEEVTRLAPCPVITVRATPEEMTLRPVKEILVPLDFSDQSKCALQHGLKLAQAHGASVKALHVIQVAYTPVGGESGVQPLGDILPDLEHARKELLDNFIFENRTGEVAISSEILVGTPYQVIVDQAADAKVDYIVMGTHGYSGLAHLVLGSTAERVMRLAPCPVYVVKHKGEAS